MTTDIVVKWKGQKTAKWLQRLLCSFREENRKVATDIVIKPMGQKTAKWLRRLSYCGRGRKNAKWPRIYIINPKGWKLLSVYGDCRAVVGEENRGHGDSREVDGPTKQLSTFGYCRKVEGAEDR